MIHSVTNTISQNMGGRAYPVRHYPIAIRLRDRGGSRHSMSCAISSEWGLFGRKTRSAIQGTSSPRKYVRKMLNILQFASNIFNCAGCALALSDTVVTNIKRVVPSDAACWKQFLSRYARTNFPTFPRSYVRKMLNILQFASNIF